MLTQELHKPADNTNTHSTIGVKIKKKSTAARNLSVSHYQTDSTAEARCSKAVDHSLRETKVLKYLLDVPVCMVDVFDSAWASLWRASAVEDCSSLRVDVVGAW